MLRSLLLALLLAVSARGATSNGNDFALAYSEAKTPAAKKAALEAARDQPHYFRYLQIMEMEPVTEEGRGGVKITAFEPGSYLALGVGFFVTLLDIRAGKLSASAIRGGCCPDLDGRTIKPVLLHKVLHGRLSVST